MRPVVIDHCHTNLDRLFRSLKVGRISQTTTRHRLEVLDEIPVLASAGIRLTCLLTIIKFWRGAGRICGGDEEPSPDSTRCRLSLLQRAWFKSDVGLSSLSTTVRKYGSPNALLKMASLPSARQVRQFLLNCLSHDISYLLLRIGQSDKNERCIIVLVRICESWLCHCWAL